MTIALALILAYATCDEITIHAHYGEDDNNRISAWANWRF